MTALLMSSIGAIANEMERERGMKVLLKYMKEVVKPVQYCKRRRLW